ncbi:CDP-diacylglycerol diphosphatase [Herbaspirillum sp. AP02]|uniref:CDP-diacylglycerol diphosphatase n=1 Tax=unclassified Herbaspirillum TaxID=2624150 RepID=UPI0015D99B0A|nr:MULTISPECIES: CDP-diacylglycerol diphosphatase [unclassified Herbaspirillum]MBG7620376.1 CDP-diacylglycerol diphosphatase [Herbaspirillum sp. AP02]NZD67840.1 CDP-diacylglycerol diphosphatase [Herbaspirillum sp. AP21]
MRLPSFPFLIPIWLLLCSQSATAAADPHKLWEITSQQCVPAMQAHGEPQPCATVDLQRGFVILKDLVGPAQYLLMPTRRLSGIESPELLREDAPRYWAYAWEQRWRVAQTLGRSREDEQLGVEVNSAAARSQLHLHLHMDCMRRDVAASLAEHRDDPLRQWLPWHFEGHRYWVMRLPADALQQDDPFRLAAARSAYAAANMASQSLLLTGARLADGSTGFFLVNMPVNFDLQEQGSAEVLMDHDCRW